MNQEKRFKWIFKCAVCRVNIDVVLNFIPNINTTETCKCSKCHILVCHNYAEFYYVHE